MIAEARDLLQYELWALRRTLAAIESCEPAPDKAVVLFAHILNAYEIWFERIEGREPAVGPFEHRSLSECADAMAGLERSYAALIEDLDARAEDPIAYHDTKGNTYTNTAREILQHVVLHSPYHRGQINQLVCDAGGAPDVIDYIAFKRQ